MTTKRQPQREALDRALKGGLSELLAQDMTAESVTLEIFTRTKLRVSASTVRRWRGDTPAPKPADESAA